MGGIVAGRERGRARDKTQGERTRLQWAMKNYQLGLGKDIDEERKRSMEGWGQGQQLFGDAASWVNPNMAGLYGDIGDLQGDKARAWDFADKPLANFGAREAGYGFGKYEDAATSGRGLFSEEGVENRLGQAEAVPRAFGSAMQDKFRRNAAAQGGFNPVATGAGIKEAAREFGEAGSRASLAERNTLDQEIHGQEMWGAEGGTGAAGLENQLTTNRWATGAGMAGQFANTILGTRGAINTAQGQQNQMQQYGMSGLEGMRRSGSYSGSDLALMEQLMNAFSLDAQTAAALLGIEAGLSQGRNWGDTAQWLYKDTGDRLGSMFKAKMGGG